MRQFTIATFLAIVILLAPWFFWPERAVEIAPLPPSTADEPARADEPSDGRSLLRFIAKEQQKNIDKLPPLKWSSVSSIKEVVPGKEHESINERLNIRSGNSGWGKTTIRWRGVQGGRSEPQGEGTRVTVWNDRYVAMFHTSTSLATMWEFDSPASMSETAGQMRTSGGGYPERVCAFGHVGKTLLEWLENEDF